MKPKDLKAPYTWEDRHPLICDHIFHLPDQYENYSSFSFPSWEEIFHSQGDVKIEFCSGNGKWILDRAVKEKQSNWVAVEWDYDRVRKIWSKVKNHALSNLFIVSGEAKTFASHYIPAGTVSEVFINFPDPWPKRRHEKNRVMKLEFIKELHRILKKGGKVTFVTDDLPYFEWTLKRALESLLFKSEVVSEIVEYGTSYFDALWRSQGKKIHFLEMRK